MKPALRESLAGQALAEDRMARVAALSAMSAGELAAVLGGDPRDAEPWVRAAAVHGVAEAQTRLGRMLLDGTGAAMDRAAALRWFERAAGGGDADAMNMVGRCYENGWGADIDEARAADWYRRSAEAGGPWGAYNYAHLLFDGRGGLGKDRAEAHRWYLRAARQGHARAMNLVARCLEAGWGIAADPRAASVWYQRSAEAGYFRAQYNHALTLIAQGESGAAQIWLDRAYAGGDAPIRTLIERRFGVPDGAGQKSERC